MMRRLTHSTTLALVLLLCTCACAKFSGSYRNKYDGLPICTARAKVEERDLNATTTVYSVATGSCNMTDLVFPNASSLEWNGTRTCQDEDTNATSTITFVKFSCHDERRPVVVANVTRIHGRCYMDFGSNGESCVYEVTESFGTLDWLIPAAIISSILAIVICCCVHQRIKKAAKPRETYEPFDGGAF